jgi:CheY-like chemotaxis protein
MTPGNIRLPKILLIDDNAGDIRLITDALRAVSPGAEVKSITDSAGAVAGLKQALSDSDGPDLVLLDLRMPKKCGLEVLADIKSDPELRYVPVVVFTSSEAEHEVFRAYELQANSVVTKPLGLARLRSTVKTLCEFWLGVARLPGGGYERESPDPDSVN